MKQIQHPVQHIAMVVAGMHKQDRRRAQRHSIVEERCQPFHTETLVAYHRCCGDAQFRGEPLERPGDVHQYPEFDARQMQSIMRTQFAKRDHTFPWAFTQNCL